MVIGQFPNSRLRRTRKFSWSRNLVRENHLTINDFIWAVFICDGEKIKNESPSMPDIFIYSIDSLLNELKIFVDKGLNAIMIFPKVEKDKKSHDACEALNENNLICRAIKAIKSTYLNLGVITDIALDPYTINGHDGISDNQDYVLNDVTVEVLCKQALNFAKAGCDIVAPSDMMDGRIGQIREYLDVFGFHDVQIMSYSVKFASSFYSPFRSSIGSNQSKPIDKSTYQLDYANSDEAMNEIEQDIVEGADYIIIKPALLYLDIIKMAKNNFDNIPIIAYNVSGEYSLAMSGIQSNLFEKNKFFHEMFLSMKRAGADIIIVYNMNTAINLCC